MRDPIDAKSQNRQDKSTVTESRMMVPSIAGGRALSVEWDVSWGDGNVRNLDGTHMSVCI